MSKNATGGRMGRQHKSPPPKTHNAPLGNPPDGMGTIASNMWKHIQKTMEWIGEPDRYIVQELCNLYEMKEVIRLKFDTGIQMTTVEIKNQGKRLHPEISLMKELQAQVTAMMRELGMTPHGRKDLEISSESEKTELDKYQEARMTRYRQREEKRGNNG